MPQNHQYLQPQHNCTRNSQHNQPPQKQQQQLLLLLPLPLLHNHHYRQHLVMAIAIILVNIVADHNVSTAAVATAAATTGAAILTATQPEQLAFAAVAVTDTAIRSPSSGDVPPIIEIGEDSANEIGNNKNQNNLAGEIVDVNYLPSSIGMSGSGVQQQQQQQQRQQHRDGLYAKFSALDKEVVDRLIKEWAPIVWLAPEEKFMPLGVDEFLNHVHPMDKGKTFIPGMPIGDDSKKAYLVTNAEIEELLENEKSFIYGRNPNESPVPIYAVVKLCNEPTKKPPSTTTAPITPQQQQTSSFPTTTQLKIIPPASVATNFLGNSNSITKNFKNSIQPLSSTRGPYIPISIDPLEMHNDTAVRRSSRLYPVFKRMRRNALQSTNANIAYNSSPSLVSSLPAMVPPILLNLPPKGFIVEPYADLMLGESHPIDFDKTKRVVALDIPTTEDAPTISSAGVESNSAQVNNFIANLADNVKFSIPSDDQLEDNNIDVDSNFEQLATKGSTSNFINDANKAKGLKMVPSFHVTYWMFYPYSQGKTICTLSLGPLGSVPFPAVYGFCLGRRKDIGSHIGDWEHMSLYFNGATEPEAMYVSAHDAGAYYSYNRLTGSFEFKKQETRKGILQRPNFPKTVTTFNNHPVLFAAKGSHGLWTAPGKHRFVKVARLYDINGFGTPWNTWKLVDITYENLKSYGRSLVPSWLSFKGKWGNPKSKCHPFRRIGLNFCEYTDGPTGIPLKEPHFQCGAT